MRRISSELRPEMLEHLGLVSALTELTTTFGRISGIRVERQFDALLPDLQADTELAMYRIAQESLTNVARHARATRVTVSLEPGPAASFCASRMMGVALTPRRSTGTAGCAACVSGPSRRRRSGDQGGATGGVEVRLEVPASAWGR